MTCRAASRPDPARSGEPPPVRPSPECLEPPRLHLAGVVAAGAFSRHGCLAWRWARAASRSVAPHGPACQATAAQPPAPVLPTPGLGRGPVVRAPFFIIF